MRSYTLLKIVLFLALAFSALYYAFWVSALQRDPIPLTNAELWPTILMLVAFPFMTRWETSLADGHARFSTAFSSYRSGGLMSPTSCRIIVGGGLAFGGAMWQCGIVLHRYLLPLPNQPRAPSTWPGILLLAELVLIVCAAYNVFLYVSFVSTSNATLNDDDDGEDDV